MPDVPSGAGRVIAVIPARGGSKGIPGKNLRLVGGRSLIARTVSAALSTPEIDCVVVSSDDDAILATAQAEGAWALRRPDELSGDTASSEAALLHAIDTLEAQDQRFDTLVFLQCTSPFTSSADLSALVQAFHSEKVASALTVSPNHGFLWKDDAKGQAQGINHDETKPRKRRQELDPEYQENGAAYGMRIPAFKDTQNRFIPPIALIKTEMPVVEIDEPADLEVVAAMVAQREGTTASTVSRPTPCKDDLRAIKVLVTDFDGVHTDDCVYLDETGRETVRCSRRDGMGVSLLRKQTDIEFLILSKETNPVVTRRAEKLKVDVIQGVGAKHRVLSEWLSKRNLGFDDLAYVGNDLNDLECLKAARIGFVPLDAHESVKIAGLVTLPHNGGDGAVRDVCDMLLALSG